MEQRSAWKRDLARKGVDYFFSPHTSYPIHQKIQIQKPRVLTPSLPITLLRTTMSSLDYDSSLLISLLDSPWSVENIAVGSNQTGSPQNLQWLPISVGGKAKPMQSLDLIRWGPNLEPSPPPFSPLAHTISLTGLPDYHFKPLYWLSSLTGMLFPWTSPWESPWSLSSLCSNVTSPMSPTTLTLQPTPPLALPIPFPGLLLFFMAHGFLTYCLFTSLCLLLCVSSR